MASPMSTRCCYGTCNACVDLTTRLARDSHASLQRAEGSTQRGAGNRQVRVATLCGPPLPEPAELRAGRCRPDTYLYQRLVCVCVYMFLLRPYARGIMGWVRAGSKDQNAPPRWRGRGMRGAQGRFHALALFPNLFLVPPPPPPSLPSPPSSPSTGGKCRFM